MDTDREEWIAKRAYELWELAGRPEGKDEEQWHAASAQWDSRDEPQADGPSESTGDNDAS